MSYEHVPVLLNEVIEYLDPRPGQNFVDATLGGGGYSQAIIQKIKPDGKLLAIDLDEDAVRNFELRIKHDELGKNAIAVHRNFAQVDDIIKDHNFSAPDGIVADIGLSSYQLDQSGRGISFQKKELLDMRFDRSQPEDARFLLNAYSQLQLEKIFREHGEEKFSKQIAKKVIENREKKIEIRYTTELYQIIQEALPKPVKHRANDSARRIFQALRIAVNHELKNLREFLPKAYDILKPGGRMAVVSFHSLEDRIVKHFFTGLAKGCVCPPDFPQCVCGRSPQAKLLTKKPVLASEMEQKQNFRSKSAKLRAIEKI